MEKHDELLLNARDYYWDSFMLDRSGSWAVVQYLSLTVVMLKSDQFSKWWASMSADGAGRDERDPDALWSLAHLLSLYDLNSKRSDVRIWAHTNLIELYLLSLIMGPGEERPDPDEAEKRALRYTDALVDIAGRDTFEVYATRRQMLRYLEWFGIDEEAGRAGEPIGFAPLGSRAWSLADKIFNKLPEEAKDKWA